MTTPSLTFIDHELVKFARDGRSGWIDVKSFRIEPSDMASEDALVLLVDHRQFRDHYSSVDSHEIDSVDLHGPYWLNSIEARNFAEVSRQRARQTSSASPVAITPAQRRPNAWLCSNARFRP